MAAITRLAVRRPVAVLTAWALLTVALVVLGLGAADRLGQPDLVADGSPSARALQVADARFGPSTALPVLLTATDDRADALAATATRVATALRARARTEVLSPLDAAVAGTPVADALRPRPGAALLLVRVARDGRADRPDADATAAHAVERVVADATRRAGVRATVSGTAVIYDQLKVSSEDAALQGEIVAFPILVIVLLLVFGTPLGAVVPAMFGGLGVAAGMGVLLLATHVTDLTVFAATLTSMMGLALGVDYVLLLVSRFREERERGAGREDAALTAARTAGGTVLLAGITLSVAMVAAMLLTEGDLLVSPAVGVLAATVVSVLAARVAMPAVLVLGADALERGRIGRRGRDRRGGGAAGGGAAAGSAAGAGAGAGAGIGGAAALARLALRRPLLSTAVALLPLLALAAPGITLDTGPGDVGQLPKDTAARAGFERLTSELGPGWAAPFELVARTPRDAPAVAALAARAATDPGVAVVLPGPRAFVVPRTAPNDDATQRLHDRLTRAAPAGVLVGGVAAELADFDRQTHDQLRPLVLGLALVTFLLLVVLFRAPLLALISVVLNLLTVAVAFGAVVLLFQGGDPPLGGPGYLEIVSMVSMFTVMFGLSLDYQVFLLHRMREGLDVTGDPRAAITWGLDRTARVVTGAAAIMVGVFLAFATTDVATVKQFGIGLAVAIAIDATAIRLVLLPAAMALGGRATWWGARRGAGTQPAADEGARNRGIQAETSAA